MKFWYCLCILFCIHCIALLVTNRYEVSYRLEDANKADVVFYCVCFSLNNLKGLANKTEFDFDQLSVELLDYFESRLPESNQSDERTDFFNRTFLVPIRSRDYQLFNNEFCFLIENYANYLLLRQYGRSFENVQYFAADRIAENFLPIKTKDAVNKLMLIINNPHPYSRCKENYSENYCLNRCMKGNARLSSYFYQANETGLITFQRGKRNATILEKEQNCFSDCYWEDCRITYLSMVEGGDAVTDCNLLVFKAFPRVEECEFWFQLISLVCFFSNNPLYSLFSKLILLAKTKIKRKSKPLEALSLLLRSAVFLAVLGYGVALCWMAILNYMVKYDNPAKNPPKMFTLSPETLKIVICVNINLILARCYRPDCSAENLYANRTLQQLEAETNVGYNDTVQEVYLRFLDRKMGVDFGLSNRTIFRDGQRCYQLIVKPTEPKYQQLISVSKLVVILKHSHHSSYLLSEDEVFSADSSECRPGFRFTKQVTIRSRSNLKVKCIDFAQTYKNCLNRFDCVQRCLGRRFISRHRNVSFWSIVDKRHFNESEWNDAFLVDDRNASTNLLNECEEAFPRRLSCREIKYRGSPMIDRPSKANDSRLLLINLYYFVHGQIEQEPELLTLYFDFLNITSVLFGLNVLRRLMAVRNWFGLKNKTCSALIYLVCLAGFTFHLFDIFKLIINGELASSQYYKQRDRMSLPGLMFCISAYNQTDIDEHQLTGNYLDEMTSRFKMETVFSEIAYLNESNNWTELKSPDFNKDENLETEVFYFASKKCFSLVVHRNYSRHQFFLTDDRKVLRISFNRTAIRRAKQRVHFFTMKPYTMQFHRIVAFDFDEVLNTSYFIRQGSFKYIVNDRFEFFRNPLLLFRKTSVYEVDDYNRNLIDSFLKIYNRTTTRLPLGKIPLRTNKDANTLTTFDLLIDDRLFDEFCRMREAAQNAESSLNFEREFIFNDLSKRSSEDLPDGQQSSDSDLEVSLSFFKGVFCFTNTETYIKLILNLLNVLHFWWDVGVLDLYGFKYYFAFVVKLLVRKLSGNLLS